MLQPPRSQPEFLPYNDGNVKNDGANAYIYDQEGRPTTSAGVTVSYDALNRPMAEQRNGTWTSIVYSPSGEKFALMNGATVQKFFIPLAGGLQAVYNFNELQYYCHSDRLMA